MGTVMIKCPTTGAAISTGIAADPASFSRTPVFIAQCYCPYCRIDHEWFAKDAWVEDGRAGERRGRDKQHPLHCAPA